jgi:hypothetical protein
LRIVRIAVAAGNTWLQQQRIVRPGRTTLRDLMVSAREGALQHVYTLLSNDLSPEQQQEIDSLLSVPVLASQEAAATQLERTLPFSFNLDGGSFKTSQ